MVPRPVASAFSRNLLQMQILRPHSRPKSQASRWFWCTLKLENHTEGLFVVYPFPVSSTSFFSAMVPLPKDSHIWLLHAHSCPSPVYSHSSISDHVIPCLNKDQYFKASRLCTPLKPLLSPLALLLCLANKISASQVLDLATWQTLKLLSPLPKILLACFFP